MECKQQRDRGKQPLFRMPRTPERGDADAGDQCAAGETGGCRGEGGQTVGVLQQPRAFGRRRLAPQDAIESCRHQDGDPEELLPGTPHHRPRDFAHECHRCAREQWPDRSLAPCRIHLFGGHEMA